MVGYAARRKYGALEYDDGVTGFCTDFPFAALRERIRTTCDEVGLVFEYASGREPTDLLVDPVSAVGHR